MNPGPVTQPATSSTSNPKPNRNCSSKSLSLVCLNCRSLLPCIDEVRIIFKENKPGLIAITETWPNDSVLEAQECFLKRFPWHFSSENQS